MAFRITDPKTILIPKDQITNLTVIYQTDAYSIAKITDRYGKQKMGVRWNVSNKENNNPNKQNGIEIGDNRLFEWLRANNYLMAKGESRNQPSQKSMNLKLMEIKKSTINNSDGSVRVTVTTKITPKGQEYFINKFLKNKELIEAI